ncbi:MAG: holo-ACP synthase [Candidatus Sungbacteria bacterium]|nr:holo-ACP synthase [Candidatus Sungbacteria bacterium]
MATQSGRTAQGTCNIGIDLVDVSRFRRFSRNPRHAFLKKVFSAREILYCFQYKKPSIHLAGIFAAKEAASKALGTARFPFAELEIRHAKDGTPHVWKNGRKLPVRVSIAHTRTMAAAVAMR